MQKLPLHCLTTANHFYPNKWEINWTKQYLGKETERLKRQLEEQYNQHLKRIDQAYRVVLSKIIAEFENIGDLTRAAFDTGKNVALRLQASINLAEAYKVSGVDIIRNTGELDAIVRLLCCRKCLQRINVYKTSVIDVVYYII